jgi:hypothetical protein
VCHKTLFVTLVNTALTFVLFQFQNMVGFLLSAIQLSLFVIYPSKGKKENKKKKK